MKRYFVLGYLFLLAAGVFAIEWEAVDVDFSFAWQRNEEIGGTRQPDLLMFTIGSSVYGDWDGSPGGFYFRPGGFLSWTTQEVEQGIARPTDEATLDHMKVLGLMADAHFGYAFDLGTIDIGVQGGPSLYLRVPLWTAQNGTADPVDFWTAYYGQLQLIYLSLASWASFPVSESMDILAGLRIHQPISNIWSGAPFFHGLQIGLTGSLRFRLLN